MNADEKSNEKSAEALRQYYADVERTFEQWRQRLPRDTPYLLKVGTDPVDENWSSGAKDIEHSVNSKGTRVAYPLTEDGRRFRFVGEVGGYRFHANGPDGVLLFYDPQTQVALLTFEWG